jgi:hypothetical protein
MLSRRRWLGIAGGAALLGLAPGTGRGQQAAAPIMVWKGAG